MPQVPVLSGQSQQLEPLTRERFRAPDTGEAGRTFAEGLANLGGSLDKAAEIQRHTDTIYAEARAKQADNTYADAEREALYGENGYYTQRGANALNSRAGVEQHLQQVQADLLAKAQDKLERQMLSDVLTRRLQNTKEGIARHAQGEALSYANEQGASRVANFGDSYIRHADDPARQQLDVQGINSELASAAQRNGWNDPEIIDAHKRDVWTGVHASMLDTLMLNDPSKARDYLAAHRGEMDPLKAQAIEKQLTPLLVGQDAKNVADLLDHYSVGNAPLHTPDPANPGSTKPASIDPTGVWSNMIGTESRGHQLDGQGNPLTSSAGAIGRAQVMPATAQMMAGELGVAWDDNRYKHDAGYNEMLGKGYFVKLIRTFGGDMTKAVAAYNAGPGSPQRGGTGVRGAIRRATAAGQPDNWQAYLPAETQGYLRKVLGDHAGNVTLGPTGLSDDARASLDFAKQLQNVDQVVRERLQGQPEPYVDKVVEATKAELRKRYEDRHIQAQAVENAQKEDAYNQVFNLHDGFTDIKQINGWQHLPADFRIQLQNTADANRKAILAGDKQVTDYGFYAGLSDTYAHDPAAFLAVPVAEARKHLSNEDFKSYVGWRKDVLQDKAKKEQGTNRTTAQQVLSIASTSLDAIPGLAVTGVSAGARANAQGLRGQFVNAMMREIDRFRATQNREPSAEEIRKQADRLVMQGSWGDPNGRKRGFVFQGMNEGFFHGEKGSNVIVPDDVRGQILKQFPRASEQEIHDLFVRYKGRYW